MSERNAAIAAHTPSRRARLSAHLAALLVGRVAPLHSAPRALPDRPTGALSEALPLIGLVSALALAAWTPLAAAGHGGLESTLVAFLKAQNADASGRVRVKIRMPRVHMGRCRSPQPFLPGRGARTAGRLTVGVRCPGDRPATRYFQADVRIEGAYFVAAHAIKPGDTITRSDIRQSRGDITRLADDAVTRPGMVLGQVAVRRVGAAMPLRTDMVARAKAIKRGDSVRIVARGRGFAITTRGKALGSAALGEAIRVRTSDGKIIVGSTRGGHTVLVGP